MNGPARRELIPVLRQIIVKACPLAERFVEDTIDVWVAGCEAETPVEKAVFQVIDELVADMDRKTVADLEEEGDS